MIFDGQRSGHDAEELMRSIVHHLADAIITTDEQGRIITFNQAAERLFGYLADEVLGKNIKMLMPQPCRSAHDEYINHYQDGGKANMAGTARELTGLRQDGTTFPMELAISIFRLGAGRYFTGSFRDITERKRSESDVRQAEERMRSAFDHAIDGIITIDTQGSVQSFNRAAEKIFGYSKEEVLGKNVTMLMPEPHRGRHDGYINGYIKTGEAKVIGTGREVIGQRKDKTTFPMELAVSEFCVGDQRFFTGIARDITHRKSLETQLQERVAELACADRQKNEFLAMLGHELRNPLAPIRNAVQLLKMPNADPMMQEQARGIMERQLEHVVRLVDDLLDVSRIVRDRIELRKAPIGIAEVLARAVETAQPVINSRGHKLITSLPRVPIYVEGDLTRLAQIVANLLTNAAKYSPLAGEIKLSAARENGKAVIRVLDQGMGIEPEFLPRIFELFVQASPTLDRSEGGLGIGLTLCKRLVEMHGGTIVAKSGGKGKGSTFIVTLPELQGEFRAARANAAISEMLHNGPKRKVLVVDDNVDAAESTAMMLRLIGHQAVCAYDGESAMNAIVQYDPEVVVIDIGLPGMNGYQVARALRADPNHQNLTLVAVTGYGQESDRQLAYEAGFDMHLTKPVDPQRLAVIVANVSAK